MAQKTISLPEEIYDKLKAQKKGRETFPELILRLINEMIHPDPQPIESFFGAFDDDSDEWGKIEEKLYEKRNRASGRKVY